MADQTQELPQAADSVAKAHEAGDGGSAQAKLSEQFVMQGHDGKGGNGLALGAKEGGPKGDIAGGMNKSEELEQQGILPGATIVYDGPVAGGGNAHETCLVTPTTRSITLLPDGSSVTTETTTTVCSPNRPMGEAGGSASDAAHGPHSQGMSGEGPQKDFGPEPLGQKGGPVDRQKHFGAHGDNTPVLQGKPVIKIPQSLDGRNPG